MSIKSVYKSFLRGKCSVSYKQAGWIEKSGHKVKIIGRKVNETEKD